MALSVETAMGMTRPTTQESGETLRAPGGPTLYLELAVRIELTLSTLPKSCFTTKLRQLELSSPTNPASLIVGRFRQPKMGPGSHKFLLRQDVDLPVLRAVDGNDVGLPMIRASKDASAM